MTRYEEIGSEGYIINQFGRCSWTEEPEYVHIWGLYVHKEYRNQGQARQLMLRAIESIRANGYIGPIQVVASSDDITVNHKRLAAFYESLGLEVYTYYS